jgi:hypothetical protein
MEMKTMRNLLIALSIFFVANPCLGQDSTTLIDTGIPDFSGLYIVNHTRPFMVSFDLDRTYEVTSIEIYVRLNARGAAATLDLTDSVGPGKSGVLKRRSLRRNHARGTQEGYEKVSFEPVTLKQGTYYVVVSSRQPASLVAIPHRAPNVRPEVNVHEPKNVKFSSPHNSEWVPLDKNVHNVGFRVRGRLAVDENTPQTK